MQNRGQMKINELLYQAPEMTEEKLLELIINDLDNFKRISKLEKRLKQIHGYKEPLEKLILKEFDLIQDKKSFLSKSQRDLIVGFVGTCLIKMTKGQEDSKYVDYEEVADGGGREDSDSETTVSEVVESGNVEQ